MAHQHGLLGDRLETEVAQRVAQPVLITAHAHVHRGAFGAGHAGDDGQQNSGGFAAQHIRVNERHQIRASLARRDRDIRLHAAVLAIHQPVAFARRHRNRLNETRHDAAVKQLNIERVLVGLFS